MLTVFRVIGILGVATVIAMLLNAPDTQENLKEGNNKSRPKIIIIMVAFFVIACVVLAQV